LATDVAFFKLKTLLCVTNVATPSGQSSVRKRHQCCCRNVTNFSV